MAKISDQYLNIDPWKIIEQGFHPERSEVSESLFSLANEHHGVRGYFDEGYSGDSLTGSYLNGIYEERFIEGLSYKGISNRLAFMVNTVNWLHTRIELDDEVLDLATSKFTEFQRQLDFQTGELIREFVWKTQTGKELRLRFARLLSMQTKELMHQKISLIPINFSGPIQIVLGLDFSVPHRMHNQNYWSCPINRDGALLGVSHSIHHRLFAGMRVIHSSSQTPFQDKKYTGVKINAVLELNNEYAIEKTIILHTDRDPEIDLQLAWNHGLSLLTNTTNNYAETLLENRHYWKSFWENSDIVIEGDPETQQGIRFCIFQMQQTYRGVVSGSNIGAKGLTGEAYNGNAFWDTETYCLPFYIFSNPQAAKSLLEFRYKTLPQAKERAKILDCEGACFPVATSDGTESCTLWQHASLQFQPTTAVAYAIWHYFKVTGDKNFLHNEGAELLVEICRFLATRGQWSAKGKFGYYAVMGPDEFQMMVNNNAYTNYLAKRTFEFTLNVLAAIDPQTMHVTKGELDQWALMAEKMNIPYDQDSHLFEQHEGFFDLPHIDVDAIPVTEFPLYHHWSYDRIYRNDMIKQPDVLMFMFLYNQSFSLEEKKANYEYYEPRCIHESSLSPSVHSIFASELGRAHEAFDFFKFATRIDLDNYNRNTHEGIHTTSIAAAWMNIVYGFGGMRSDGEQLVFNPTIPSHWKSYRFQVKYHGSVIRVEVNQSEVVFQIMSGDTVTIRVGETLQDLSNNKFIQKY